MEGLVKRLELAIPVSNLEESVDWYVKYLDCQVVWWAGPVCLKLPSGQELLLVGDWDTDEESIWYAGRENFRSNPYYSIQLVVGDGLIEFHNKLKESGVSVNNIIDGGVGKIFSFYDPSGNRFWAVES
jgi:catechol 2,3-dioxygenase-like lactoylglutathione lyase family enzyme